MPDNKLQQKNSLNIFLNERFNLLVILGVVLIFVFGYFLFIGPKLKLTVETISDNVETQKRLYSEQQKKLNDLKIMQATYDKITPEDLERFNGVLPNVYLEETLFGELEEIITQRGFLIESVTIESNPEAANSNLPAMGGSVEALEGVGEITVRVSISAINYSGLKQLLTALEVNSRLFDIKEVTFSDNENSAQLELITYYYQPL